ncbi:putative Enoyl-CoA hydratase [Vibrio nigripulchritudo MADA3029]|uniref:Enoyl-CoA hydratase n=2 Tax=Vibrio nigripulchritudo TaxID=28173 RepID=A0AAV2VNH2_9VIBR|nr:MULTISPECIES: enoyl-CoA hydratase/isomerase family protein [Vibrio]UAB68842.1 enoyl-CoA hydratase/isomerase family protein [Vibrio sp. SCSIO 43132]CCN46729.1 putative Enoyl-CoA hydratase [Vibrio nigripulchritudo MADA3020]CCN51990.1 putative Enoyl-CoA hydratase [Vibrio nigripulchritudo MADA3021]CCN61811.1 putative Enoyl-CoA hydratase [Vibrio nigripulchritudo MADA3029]CCN84123.1 putative Enoyl-CoA hydratase [Vibrio nigripulchritudo BLFn1]
MSDHILFNVEDGIATLTLNRPDKLNAITAAMGTEIVQYAKQVDTDDDIKVLVIAGQGERAFSAGSDVNMLDDLGTAWEGRNRANYDRDYIAPLLHLRKPAIAAIDGYCLGGGLEVAICCDIRIATPRSRFGAPEIQRGWHAGSGNTSILPRLVGFGNAAMWILTGELMSAEESHRVGFVQKIVSEDDLMSEAKRLAKRIAQNPPIAVQSAKNVIRQSQGTSIEQGLSWENDGYTLCMMTDDAAEGIAAFGEKREPVFKGR